MQLHHMSQLIVGNHQIRVHLHLQRTPLPLRPMSPAPAPFQAEKAARALQCPLRAQLLAPAHRRPSPAHL